MSVKKEKRLYERPEKKKKEKKRGSKSKAKFLHFLALEYYTVPSQVHNQMVCFHYGRRFLFVAL